MNVWSAVLWEAHLRRFEDAFHRYKKRTLTAEEAGELLGISARHFRHQCGRFETDGEDGLPDRRIGRVSRRRAPESELERMRRLYREEFAEFTVKHFHEHIRRALGYILGYTVARLALRQAMQGRRQAAANIARSGHAGRCRECCCIRTATHRWIALGLDVDLIVTMDDAPNRIYSAFCTEQEGTMSSFRGLRETIEAHGLFSSLYTDRGSHYFFTPKAGGEVDRKQLTQVGRALKQLGIRHIPS